MFFFFLPFLINFKHNSLSNSNNFNYFKVSFPNFLILKAELFLTQLYKSIHEYCSVPFCSCICIDNTENSNSIGNQITTNTQHINFAEFKRAHKHSYEEMRTRAQRPKSMYEYVLYMHMHVDGSA